MMIIANLVGFAVGVDGIQEMLRLILTPSGKLLVMNIVYIVYLFPTRYHVSYTGSMCTILCSSVNV
jgi:hypothetical protein